MSKTAELPVNTKGTNLVFHDVVLGQNFQQPPNELGRIFIQPVPFPVAQNFVDIFGTVGRAFMERGRIVASLGKLLEVKRNAYAKFAFDVVSIDSLTGGQFDQGVTNFAFANQDAAAAAQTPSPSFASEPNGLVIFNTSGQQPSFYILTSSWSAQDTPGDIVGTVYKGMELVQHMTWLSTDAEHNVTENCLINDMGVISPGSLMGIKQRDSLLDPFPDLPGDSNLDYRDFETMLAVAFKIKNSGSLLFRQERYQMARFRFGKAVRYLAWATERQKITLDQEMKALQIIVPCILNSAACRLKLRDFDGALEDCNEAMELWPNNYKAYFRRGQAHHGKMNYEQSLYDLYTALKLCPDDRAIKNEIAAVEGEMQVYKKVPSRRNSEETAMQTQ